MRIISSIILLTISSVANSQQFPLTEPIVPFPLEAKLIVGDSDFQKVIQFSQGSEVRELGKGVAHLVLGQEGFCSGFLINSDTLMTNEHCVVRDGQVRQPSQIAIHMDYYTDNSRGEVSARGQEYLAINASLDYALVALDRSLGDRYSFLTLSNHIPDERDPVKIIQHPRGRSKEISRRNSEVVRVDRDNNIIHYLADTEGGSSGSPVFDLNGSDVIALHHAGISSGFNEGILMASILIDLGLSTRPVAANSQWLRYEQWVENGQPLRFETDRVSYVLGQNMKMDIDIPVGGYLHLINISQQDETILLYPNKYQRDNLVSAGQMTFPSESMPFDMTAMEPIGSQLLVVVITNEPLDLYSESDLAGNTVFAPIDSKSMGSMSRHTARKGQYWAGKAEVQIVR